MPSSCASTSIWALSVSISSKTSPVEKESPANRLMSFDVRLHTVFPMFSIPSLTFQVAMFPSVIVGDMAGIVKFCAASDFEAQRNPSIDISRLSYVLYSVRAMGEVVEPRDGALRDNGRLESLVAPLHAAARQVMSLQRLLRTSASSGQCWC